jgi:hypothetical protein
VNGTLEQVYGDYILEINNSIICKMNFGYSLYEGSLAGWGIFFRQVIVFDEFLNVTFIYLFLGQGFII